MTYDAIPARGNEVSKQVVDAAYQVHKTVGPGLLESFYEAALAHELRSRGLEVRTQVGIQAIYKDVSMEIGYRIDILVEGCVVVEVKSCDGLTPIFDAQVLTYLKLTGCRVGLIVNFNVPLIKEGIKRLAL